MVGSTDLHHFWGTRSYIPRSADRGMSDLHQASGNGLAESSRWMPTTFGRGTRTMIQMSVIHSRIVRLMSLGRNSITHYPIAIARTSSTCMLTRNFRGNYSERRVY